MTLSSTIRCRVLMVNLSLSLLFNACREPDIFIQPEMESTGDTTRTEVIGFYLLNEGNMGSNKASLDYYDFSSGTYTRNIYQAVNPEVKQSLGDVGNDIKIYGSRLYAVINCSNLVEVMDAATTKHIGTIQVPNCRYLAFKDGYGYLTSYAGPVVVDATKAQIGYVAKFDTTTLQIVDTCHVGFQPDELEVVGNQLYVANSGGYMVPNYEHTVSVIDLENKSRKTIDVVNNLHRLRADRYGQIWVSSRGDYYDQPSRLYCIDTKTDKVTDSVMVAVSNMWIDGDSLYICATEFSYITYDTEVTYAIVNVKTHEIVTRNFIQDPTVKIDVPYGIAVNPKTKDIYVTDAKNYVSPGTLWCIGQNGMAKWSVRTGDIPAHICFRFKTEKI
ncbi:MAG: YncE family protein [Bacteroidales bacterium]|nr:YncE family protein [Candidatus Colicola caccequi]